MFIASLAGLSVILALVAIQLGATTWFALWFRQRPKTIHDDFSWPPAAIVLSVRGLDSTLSDCLNRLATLDYPRYEIQIVIDHETDPSAAVIRSWTRQHPDVAVTTHVLRDISPAAYLKASAVRQCLRALDRCVQVAAIVDADTMVYPTWLKDMVRPMIGTKVGVVTGNRWYDPTVKGWGSLVRFIYNANAVVPMYFMRATWGGSLTIRREVFDQPYFSERMWRTSCEDSAIQDANRRAGYELEIQPNAMLLNEDSIGLASCFRFIRRQLLWTRLYHPRWTQILVGTAFNYSLMLAASVGMGLAAWQGEWRAAAVLGGAVALVTGLNLALIEWLHRIVSLRMRREQNTVTPVIDLRTRLRLLAALPLALVIHSFATFAAAIAQEVTWRGIRYQVQPPDGLRLIKYQPIVSPMTPAPAHRTPQPTLAPSTRNLPNTAPALRRVVVVTTETSADSSFSAGQSQSQVH